MTAWVKLAEDLDRMIEGYETDPSIPQARRQRWFRDGKRKAITHGMIGKDHEKALQLESGEGYEGGPVGSFLANTARRFWDNGEGHVFPPLEDLVRLGIFMNTDFYRMVFLLLKREWEYFFAHEFMSWRPNRGIQYLDVVMDAEEHVIREAQHRFRPDSETMFKLLEKYGRMDDSVGRSERSFGALIQEMMLSNLHRVGIESKELDGFIGRKKEERRLLTEGTQEQQEGFLVSKFRWIEKQEELEDLHLRIEEERLRSVEVARRWLTVFGREEIELKMQIHRYQNLEMRFSLKLADPELTWERIEERVREAEAGRDRDLHMLRLDAAIAPHLEPDRSASPAAEEILAYRNQCKKMLRRIYGLIHPDHLVHSPVYQRLSSERQEDLRQIIMDAFAVNSFHLFDPGLLERLQAALNKVEAILEYPDLSTEVEMIIRGETLSEQLSWLDRECRRIEGEIALARARLQAAMENTEVLQKRDILNNPTILPAVKTDMVSRAATYSEKADSLEQNLKRLFRPDGGVRSGDAL